MILIRPKTDNGLRGGLRGGSPVDWLNPITRNLVAAYLFDDASPLVLIDSTGIAGNCTQGGTSNVVSYLDDPVWGMAGRFGRVLNNSRFFQNNTYNLPTGDTTLLQIVNTTTNLDASTFGNLDSGTTTRYQCNNPFSGTVYFDFGGSSSPNRVNFTPGGGFFNLWHVMIWTAGSTGMAIYVDGVSQASSGTAVTRTNTTAGFGVGGGLANLDAGSNNASIALHLLFTRILSAAEIKQISLNPWIVFRPQPQTTGVRYFIAEAVAPTSSLFRTANLTGIGSGGPFFGDPL